MDTKTDSDAAWCFICGEDNPHRLQEHHLVPKRYGGSNDSQNIITLCAGCHQCVEKLYDQQFYDELGVTKLNPEDKRCLVRECDKRGTVSLNDPRPDNNHAFVCEEHSECVGFAVNSNPDHCPGEPDQIAPTLDEDSFFLLCEGHAVCEHDDCYASDVFQVVVDGKSRELRCTEHAKRLSSQE